MISNRYVYSETDYALFKSWLNEIKTTGLPREQAIRELKILERFEQHFHRPIKSSGFQSLLRRVEFPEKVQAELKRYAENKKLRAQGILPPTQKSINANNVTAAILSKYPFIIVMRDNIAGYETLEQAKDAIINSQIVNQEIKLFEVKERKIQSSIVVNID